MHSTCGLQHHRCVIHLHHSRQDARGHRGPASLAKNAEAHHADSLACQKGKKDEAAKPLPLSGRTHPPHPQPCPLQSSHHSALGVSAQTLLPSESLPRSPKEEAGTCTELPALHLLKHFSVSGCAPALRPQLDWVVTFWSS